MSACIGARVDGSRCAQVHCPGCSEADQLREQLTRAQSLCAEWEEIGTASATHARQLRVAIADLPDALPTESRAVPEADFSLPPSQSLAGADAPVGLAALPTEKEKP